MTPQDSDRINKASGRELYQIMRWAQKNKQQEIFNACYERARVICQRNYGRWEDAKKSFETMMFPSIPHPDRNFYQTTRVLGYLCEFVQDIDEKLQIKTKLMALINPKTNSCALRQLIQNGEVVFR